MSEIDDLKAKIELQRQSKELSEKEVALKEKSRKLDLEAGRTSKDSVKHVREQTQGYKAYSSVIENVKKKIAELEEKTVAHEFRRNKLQGILTKKEEKLKKIESDRALKYKGNDKILKRTPQRIKEARSAVDKMKVSLEKEDDLIKDTISKQKKLANALEESGSIKHYAIKSEQEFNDALEHRLKLQEMFLDNEVKDNRMKAEGAEFLKRQLRSEENIAEERKDLVKYTTKKERPVAAYRENLREFKPARPQDALTKAREERLDLSKEMGGRVKSFVTAKGFSGRMEAAKGIQESLGKFKALNETLGKTAGTAKGVAGMFGTLGTAMGMLGKIGWIGLIISAVTMIAKTINELNKFVKDYNKSFVKMYGPTVALKDVSKSMKSFTDSVFDMNRNLKYGLKSEDIMGLFDAMSAGGMSLQGVGKRVKGDYNEVILEAAKLSKDFGVDMSVMGGMIADQMINLKSSLDDVKKSMEAMAYDATIAGISSQKFYDAVTAATDSLAYYGNYLKSTSALLRTFADKGAMPFKDAAKEAQDIMNVFRGMDTTKKMGFIQIVGEPKVREDMTLRAEQMKREEDVLDDQIATARRVGEIEKAQALEQEKANKKRIRINLEAYAKGDIQALATGLDYMADKSVDYMVTALHKVGVVDIFDTDNLLAKSKILAESAGVPAEALTKLLETGRVVLDDAKDSAKFIGDSFEKIPEDSSKKLKDIMKGLMSSISKGDAIDEDDLRTTLNSFVSSGGELGMNIEDFINQFKKNAFALDAAVSGVHLNANNTKKFAEDLLKQGVSFTGGAADQNKRIDDIVKNTATFEDFLGIGKENMKYMAAMAGGGKLQDMANEAAMVTARAAGGIFGLLQKWVIGKGKEYVTDEQYMAKGGDYDTLVAASKVQGLLQKKLYDLQAKYDKSVSPADKEVLAEQIEQAKAQIKEQEAIKTLLSKDRPELASGAVYKGGQEAQEDIGAKTKLENRKSELEAKLKGGKLSEMDASSVTAEISEVNRKLDDLNKAINIVPAGPISSGEVKEPIKSAPVAEGDFEALTGGMTKVSKGDMVIDSDSLARGLSGSKGQFVNKLLSDTGGAAGSNVVVHMTFGDLHEIHDVDGFLKEVGPAFKQLVARELHESRKRP